VLLGLPLSLAAGIGACILLLPPRYRVNGPMLQILFGKGSPVSAEAVRARLRAPAGFAASVFAADLPNARLMRFTTAGDLLVSLPRSGRVILLEADRDGDGRSDGRRELLKGLNRPHGLDLHEGWLYVGETDAIGRVRFDPGARQVSGTLERVVTGLPSGGNHWTRTIRFGPDGWLYASIGSSCNVCVEEDQRRAAIMRFRPDGSRGEVFASGLRNSVGFDWRPGTDELFATDNGRDLLGDDEPPCELNRVERGQFYGWPVANGDRVPDPDFGKGQDERIAGSTPPAHGFRAHTAPLGIAFLRGDVPAEYRGAALVALHGSWNRTRKDGYKVVSLHWDEAGGISERDFLVGFEKDEDVIGRPVDVAEGPDGAFYVSDDYAGSIYRVSRGTSADASAPAAAPAATAPAPAEALPTGPEAEASIKRGRATFERSNCRSCHDPARAPKGMVTKPVAGLRARYTLASLDQYLRAPTPPMPAPDLSDQERRDLALYLLSACP
jgi:glucose/arabinose dehydrogenase